MPLVGLLRRGVTLEEAAHIVEALRALRLRTDNSREVSCPQTHRPAIFTEKDEEPKSVPQYWKKPLACPMHLAIRNNDYCLLRTLSSC